MNRNGTILLLGSRNAFTATVLLRLVDAGFVPARAVVLKESSDGGMRSRSGDDLTVSVPDPLARAAERNDVPLASVAHPEAIADTGPPPDLVVTACFPRRLSRGLLRWPRAGGLNLHPSLLPAYRGPSPLFWQLRDGVDCGGITVHRLSEGLDAGDVVAAKGLSLPAGATAESLLESLVDAGAGLLIEALEQYAWDRIPCRPQGPGGLSYFPWPREEDFRFPATWSAERAFRFMRGTAAWGRPFVVQTARGALALERAVDFEPDARLDEPWTDDGERGVRVAFEPGVLSAVARPESLRPRP